MADQLIIPAEEGMQAGPEQFQTPAADAAFHKIFHISSMSPLRKNIPEQSYFASRYCGKVP